MTSASTDVAKHWSVTRTVELGASRQDVWDVIGGFYTIHQWHPDIKLIEIPTEQTATRQLRRILTFAGEPKTTEELLSMDNDDCLRDQRSRKLLVAHISRVNAAHGSTPDTDCSRPRRAQVRGAALLRRSSSVNHCPESRYDNVAPVKAGEPGRRNTVTTPVRIKVYANNDDALIFWSVPETIPDCLGFAIERRIYDPADPTNEKILHTNVLPNRIGFEGDPDAKPGSARVSTKWPFQRFWWTDHAADQGDIVSYRVIPMMEPAEKPVKHEDLASEWSPVRVLLAPPNSRFDVFFNRGFVISQFMARYLDREKITPAEFKKRIGADLENYIRRFLYGNLGATLLNELGTAQTENGHVYAALYELDDEQLIQALCEIGPRAHVVLSNGSIAHKKGAKAVDERKLDQNEDARRRLLAASVDVGESDRFLSPGSVRSQQVPDTH